MKTIVLRVTPQQAQTIVASLENIPFKIANGLIQSIVEQANQQLQENAGQKEQSNVESDEQEKK